MKGGGFLFMIVITKGTEEDYYFTGSELATLTNPLFLFIFTHRTTQEEVRLITFKLPATTKRYDTISIQADVDFLNSSEGFWTYDVYETLVNNAQQSIANLNKVESGLMYLKPASNYEPTKYDEQDTSFTTYNGQ